MEWTDGMEWNGMEWIYGHSYLFKPYEAKVVAIVRTSPCIATNKSK